MDYGPRTAFSFAEVMFAVVILGIGFILVAAIFPVAIGQSQKSSGDSAAAAVAREAANAIAAMPKSVPNPIYTANPTAGSYDWPSEKISTISTLPPTVKPYVRGMVVTTAGSPLAGATLVPGPPSAVVVPFTGDRWALVRGNVVLPSDPRYAYVAFYKRESGAAFATLYVLAVAAQSKPTFDPTSADVYTQLNSGTGGGLVSTQRSFPLVAPIPTVLATLTQTIIHPDMIAGALQEGQVARFNPQITPSYGNPNGRSYRIGSVFGRGFALEPGDDMTLAAGSSGIWGGADAVTDLPSKTTYNVSTDARWNLEPTVAYAQFTATAANPAGRIVLFNGPKMTDMTVPTVAAQGAFVIIADDYPFDPLNATGHSTADGGFGYEIPPNVVPAPYFGGSATRGQRAQWSIGALNGRVFRLGAPAANDADVTNSVDPTIVPLVFNLDPQYGMRPVGTAAVSPPYSPDTVPNPDLVDSLQLAAGPVYRTAGRVKVYIVGAPTSGGKLVGDNAAAQDIGFYSTPISAE